MDALDAVADSVRLALRGNVRAACDVVDAAVRSFSLSYSAHPPAALYRAVRATRKAATDALERPLDAVTARRLHNARGWGSALLGNLAHHLGDPQAAGAHLSDARHLADVTGDSRLISWTFGAAAMVARDRGDFYDARSLAVAAFDTAPGAHQRSAMAAWARMRAAAALRDTVAAEEARDDAEKLFEADTPGRFGFDRAALLLHLAESYLDLARPDEALEHAEASAGLVARRRPAWAAARLTVARAHAAAGRWDAAELYAHEVLDAHEPARLRSTARARLAALVRTGRTPRLAERVRDLPVLVRGLTDTNG
ncbi:hypothetical protein Afil01_55630 [Actinorhabdospora filicis]|uniref:XRE family transcriptional regulator n=1 Tax=Actinorhabdospora filicis TaxID=1785913 RepID=A0A9W6SU27_9ACTN|nr:hypothetical protein [Actinorhabdospora filicis]GLZ80756.1 hypothetical protein Afil01_55630 [Actinorhabdospora filicis]